MNIYDPHKFAEMYEENWWVHLSKYYGRVITDGDKFLDSVFILP